jgi:RNA polymerase sigma-70 factor (ECF subfamily)
VDEIEFRQAYEQTVAPLRAYVLRTLGSLTHVDDIVQETYLRLLRLPSPPETLGELRPYLFRIASNLMVDHWRRHKHETQAGDRPEAVSPVSMDHNVALEIDMGRLFQRLRPRDRQLLWLAHVEGASHREIATALGLSLNSIKVLLFRARQRLSALLEQSGHGTGHAQ